MWWEGAIAAPLTSREMTTMRHDTKTRLGVESLEARDCPSGLTAGLSWGRGAGANPVGTSGQHRPTRVTGNPAASPSNRSRPRGADRGAAIRREVPARGSTDFRRTCWFGRRRGATGTVPVTVPAHARHIAHPGTDRPDPSRARKWPP